MLTWHHEIVTELTSHEQYRFTITKLNYITQIYYFIIYSTQFKQICSQN